jgi:Fur family ferric uptake transcriptional regulator
MNKPMDIPKELRESGLKATLPRLRILHLFSERQVKHLSAEDVYRFLLEEKIDVGLATVYRVLVQFAEAGILIRRHFESGAAVFEINEGNHHDHLICTVCGKVEEFMDSGIERRQEEIAKELGFVLQTHALSLYGVCADCTKKNKSRTRIVP